MPLARLLALLALAGCAAQTRPGRSLVAARIVAINDFHGYLTPPAETVRDDGKERAAGGVAFLGAHVARLRKERPGAFALVAAGDLVGASPLLSALFHDEPTILAMNLLGLDVLGVGNHEFDEGTDELLRMARGGCHPGDGCALGAAFPGARFAVLAANVRRRGARETLFPPYVVKPLGGVPVAFIGMTLEGTPLVAPPVVADLEFGDEVETANALVPELLARGVRAIVVVLHEGGLPQGGYDACQGLRGPVVAIAEGLHPEVDLVLSGHTHQAYNCQIAGKHVTSAGSYGRYFTQVELSLDPASGDVVAVDAHNRIVSHDVPPDPDLLAVVQRFEAAARPIADRVVARIEGDLSKRENEAGESVLGSVIADAQLEATRAPERGGAVLAFMNSGGIRTSLEHEPAAGEAEPGLVRYGEIFAVQPFGNTLVTVSLTGAEIQELLEDQWEGGSAPRFMQVSGGFRYAWRSHARPGQRVVRESLALDGKPIVLEQSYRVTVNSFMAQRGVLARGRDPTAGPPDLAAFEAYLAARSPFAPPARGRIERRD